jgi:hypothetical protein
MTVSIDQFDTDMVELILKKKNVHPVRPGVYKLNTAYGALAALSSGAPLWSAVCRNIAAWSEKEKIGLERASEMKNAVYLATTEQLILVV